MPIGNDAGGHIAMPLTVAILVSCGRNVGQNSDTRKGIRSAQRSPIQLVGFGCSVNLAVQSITH